MAKMVSVKFDDFVKNEILDRVWHMIGDAAYRVSDFVNLDMERTDDDEKENVVVYSFGDEGEEPLFSLCIQVEVK